MIDFAVEVVKKYTINSNCVRAAVIRYNNSADVLIQLDSYSDVNQLVFTIFGIKYVGGSSNLSAALDLLRTRVFASNIVRPNTAQICVIVTDRLHPSSQLDTAASRVRSQGITILAVGVTGPGRVNTDVMYSIASNRWAIAVSDYGQLISGARNIIVQQYGCFAFTTTSRTTTTLQSQFPSPSKYSLGESLCSITWQFE